MDENQPGATDLNWTDRLNSSSSSSYNDEVLLVWYYINGLGGTLIAVLGIAGNVTAALVLTMPVMRNSTSILLVVMAAFDTVFLILHCLVQSFTLVLLYHDIGDGYLVVREFLFKYCKALVHISYTGTIYMAVLVTLERALAVLLPLKTKHICTRGRAWLASVAVTLWSIIYNIPKYLEFEADDQLAVTRFSMKKSEFGNSYFFNQVYVIYFNGAVHFIIPVALITVLNLKMIQTVCSRAKRMARRAVVRSYMQTKLTYMIMTLTAIFCLCQMLAALPLILFPDENVGKTNEDGPPQCQLTCTVVRAMGETSTLLNSATNFIVYSICGHKFRRCLKQMCCLCCRRAKRGRRLYASYSRWSPPYCLSTITRFQRMEDSVRLSTRRAVGTGQYKTVENNSDESRVTDGSQPSNSQ